MKIIRYTLIAIILLSSSSYGLSPSSSNAIEVYAATKDKTRYMVPHHDGITLKDVIKKIGGLSHFMDAKYVWVIPDKTKMESAYIVDTTKKGDWETSKLPPRCVVLIHIKRITL